MNMCIGKIGVNYISNLIQWNGVCHRGVGWLGEDALLGEIDWSDARKETGMWESDIRRRSYSLNWWPLHGNHNHFRQCEQMDIGLMGSRAWWLRTAAITVPKPPTLYSIPVHDDNQSYPNTCKLVDSFQFLISISYLFFEMSFFEFHIFMSYILKCLLSMHAENTMLCVNSS